MTKPGDGTGADPWTRFEEITGPPRQVLNTTVNWVLARANENSWTPADASPAGVEQQEGVCVWGTTLDTARLLIIALTDHLEAVAKLLSPPAQAYAPWVAARAANEAAARLWWLTEPSLEPQQRTGRALSLRLRALREQARLPDAEAAKIEEVYTTFVAEAEEAGLEVTRDGNGNPNAIKHVDRPGPSRAVNKLAEAAFPEGADTHYMTLSGFAHADPLALQAMMGPIDQDDPTAFELTISVRGVFAVLWSTFAPSAEAIARVAGWLGWAPAKWENFRTLASTIIGDISPDPASRQRSRQLRKLLP